HSTTDRTDVPAAFCRRLSPVARHLSLQGKTWQGKRKPCHRGSKGRHFNMRYIARLLGFIFTSLTIVFIVGAAAAGIVVWKFEQDLPDYTQLKNYEPPVMTRVHAADGSVLAEYSRERRLYLPSSAIPPLVKQAFISAEDKNFYTHNGVDPEGIMRAMLVLLQGSKRLEGASTITQQV